MANINQHQSMPNAQIISGSGSINQPYRTASATGCSVMVNSPVSYNSPGGKPTLMPQQQPQSQQQQQGQNQMRLNNQQQLQQQQRCKQFVFFI